MITFFNKIIIFLYSIFILYYTYIYTQNVSVDFHNMINILSGGSLTKWITEGEIISGSIIGFLFLSFGSFGISVFYMIVVLLFLILIYNIIIQFNSKISSIKFLILTFILLYNPLYTDFTNQQVRQLLLSIFLILFINYIIKNNITKSALPWAIILIIGILIHKSAILLIPIIWLSFNYYNNIKSFLLRQSINKSLFIFIIMSIGILPFVLNLILNNLDTYTDISRTYIHSIGMDIFTSSGMLISLLSTFSIIFITIKKDNIISMKLFLLFVLIISSLNITLYGVNIYEIQTRVFKPILFILFTLSVIPILKSDKLFIQTLPFTFILVVLSGILQYKKYMFMSLF